MYKWWFGMFSGVFKTWKDVRTLLSIRCKWLKGEREIDWISITYLHISRINRSRLLSFRYVTSNKKWKETTTTISFFLISFVFYWDFHFPPFIHKINVRYVLLIISKSRTKTMKNELSQYFYAWFDVSSKQKNNFNSHFFLLIVSFR